MIIAIDKEGNRVYPEEAEKGKEYLCPCCDERLVLKKGNWITPYFSHKAKVRCKDNWKYDTSDWNTHMKNYFARWYRDVVVEYKGKKHKADILKDNIVVEFQHNSISDEYFKDKTAFFVAAGYKVIWVFDANNWFYSGAIKQYSIRGKGDTYFWGDPPEWLVKLDYLRPQLNNRNVTVCLSRTVDKEQGVLDKVFRLNWVSKDCTNVIFNERETYLLMDNDMDLSLLFYPQDRWRNRVLKDKEYDIKYQGWGLKGYPYETYICPRTAEFINKNKENKNCDGCDYCIAKESRIIHGKLVDQFNEKYHREGADRITFLVHHKSYCGFAKGQVRIEGEPHTFYVDDIG